MLNEYLEVLEELRWRVIRSLIYVASFSFLSYFFSNDIFILLIKPFRIFYSGDLFFTNLSDKFFTIVKISFASGFSIAIPFILFEIWCLINPALYKKEKFYLMNTVIIGSLLFVSGVWLSYKFVLPITIKFFLDFGGDLAKPIITINSYFDFATALILSVGIIFEFPLMLIVLHKINLISPERLIHQRKYIYVLLAVIVAIITPTQDGITMAILLLPLYLLFEISLLIMKIINKKS